MHVSVFIWRILYFWIGHFILGAQSILVQFLDRRCGSDPVLLWHKPAVTAPIWPLAWEPPCASDVALEKRKKKKTEKRKKKRKNPNSLIMYI